MTFPHGDLARNLAEFCSILRTEYGFRIGPAHLVDAVRALHQVPLAEVRTVRHALRPVLSSSLADSRLFDLAFDRFFLLSLRAPHLESPPLSGAHTRDEAPAAERRHGPGHREQAADEMRETSESIDAPVSRVSEEERPESGDERVVHSRYSPLQGEGPAPELDATGAEWRHAAAALERRVHLGLSRRWRPSPRGTRFDLRRTLRGSLHTAGEMVLPRWRARPRRRPRFLLVIDGSRSMSGYSTVPLQIAVALAAVTRSVEVFAFSTDLSCITAGVRRAAAGAVAPLERLHHSWGGGTAIGSCLGTLVHDDGGRLLRRDALVIIASDGLDVGPPEVLRESLATIRRRVAGIVWLNPLVTTAGYEPTASGMSTARPFLTDLTWVAEPRDLVDLAGRLRLHG